MKDILKTLPSSGINSCIKMQKIINATIIQKNNGAGTRLE